MSLRIIVFLVEKTNKLSGDWTYFHLGGLFLLLMLHGGFVVHIDAFNVVHMVTLKQLLYSPPLQQSPGPAEKKLET